MSKANDLEWPLPASAPFVAPQRLSQGNLDQRHQVAVPDLAVLERHWYALVVQPRHEKAVGGSLRTRGLEALCPTYQAARRWSDRIKVVDFPLFAGYVFCRFSYRQRLVALGTAGVRSIVSFGPAPQPIPEAEITALQSIGRSGLPARPWPYLRAGQRVQVVKGCLAGLEGILAREKDLFRVVVSVEMLMRSVAVEVERDSIVPARLNENSSKWAGGAWRYQEPRKLESRGGKQW